MKKNTLYGLTAFTIGLIATGDKVGLLWTVILLLPMAYCLKRFIETMED